MRLTRPLWKETAEYRRYRRVRFALLTPVAAFAGGLWGSLAGGVGSILGGAGLFTVGAWLHTRIYPALTQWAQERWGRGRIAAFLWDTTVVALGGLVLTRALGFPWSPAVATSLALGGAAALGFAWFLQDGGTRAFHALVSPLGRTGGERVPFSHVEAQLARGAYPEARDALEELVDRYPRSVEAWVTLARLYAGPMEDADEGVRVLEDGLHALRRTPALQLPLLKQVLTLRTVQGDPLRAAPLLARHAERWGDSDEGRWARQTLARLKETLRADP